jgi:iron complex transport system ATP-binding protein
MIFDATAVSFRYARSSPDVLRAVDVQIAEGEMVALLGPNGSGKSTLLRVLLGALQPQSGAVMFLARPVQEWARADIARRVGVVTQHEDVAFPLTVHELVAMGRYPHLGAWRSESAADRAAIVRALQQCELTELRERAVTELSGGERQRARVARALAQEPRTLVLDEPTASLDIGHEMALFELLARLRDAGVTIVIATHNINLAARYADRLVLLHRGAVAAAGEPAGVLTRDGIERVYEWPVRITAEGAAPQVVPLRRTIPSQEG